ncbi:Uncharacterised protein [uncultured archaeon]|nr:Uncharacterised protein [uncultured archaeon]
MSVVHKSAGTLNPFMVGDHGINDVKAGINKSIAAIIILDILTALPLFFNKILSIFYASI